MVVWGERNGRAKVSDDVREYMRKLYRRYKKKASRERISIAKLAVLYDLSTSTVWHIVNNK